MIKNDRHTQDGITYFWFMYRDGRTIQMYHGVTEQWKLDQDVSDSMEERYTFRRQAKRRLKELIAEKQAEGYRQDDIYGMQPGRKEREKFRRLDVMVRLPSYGARSVPVRDSVHYFANHRIRYWYHSDVFSIPQ
ncbi:hypothetical protein OVA29_12625 [Exiguobacterium sp. SL14]|nr:hypothetical protein [Exiguobacterium sp. SL14]MCY1691431.1 hypothetical protein [Exiguobacterium sp. SL14]